LPECDQAQLALDPADLVWKLTVPDLPAGNYEFKAALDRSCNVNYGVPNGGNVPFAGGEGHFWPFRAIGLG
jgi:alpha-amylase